jgi:lysozyme
MVYSDLGLSLLEREEALRLVGYPDGGKIATVGYGHTGPEVFVGMVITREQAIAYLRSDTAKAQAAVNKYVRVPLRQGQFDALVDFTFNVGIGAFANSHLLAAVNAGNFAQAEAEFNKWIFVKGTVSAGLQSRRAQEIKEFES